MARVGRDLEKLRSAAHEILEQGEGTIRGGISAEGKGQKRSAEAIPLWDGHAAERISDVILQRFST